MVALVKNELTKSDDLNHFEIRVGIHTGPVVAGIVGIKKWQYDIWGDTVNIASRMESNSRPGRVNLSETTYQIIKDEFPCEYRGEIEVKNHGSVKMYFLL
jgi:class 3 adenylate cyclase